MILIYIIVKSTSYFTGKVRVFAIGLREFRNAVLLAEMQG